MFQLLGQKKKWDAGYQKGKPAFADLTYRPPHKPTEIQTQIIPRKNI